MSGIYIRTQLHVHVQGVKWSVYRI
jgi:hypothetical protein